jgi:hypothetical protein
MGEAFFFFFLSEGRAERKIRWEPLFMGKGKRRSWKKKNAGILLVFFFFLIFFFGLPRLLK